MQLAHNLFAYSLHEIEANVYWWAKGRNLFWDHFPKLFGSRAEILSGDWSLFA